MRQWRSFNGWIELYVIRCKYKNPLPALDSWQFLIAAGVWNEFRHGIGGRTSVMKLMQKYGTESWYWVGEAKLAHNNRVNTWNGR